VSAEPVQKRGPGRPRKYPKVLASGHPQEHPVAEEVLLHPVAGEELQKRPRGRPPKPKAEAVLKRPRGRPPKVRDAEASVVQMSSMGFMFKHHLQYKGRLLLTHFFYSQHYYGSFTSGTTQSKGDRGNYQYYASAHRLLF
jgi:hypothetical protein